MPTVFLRSKDGQQLISGKNGAITWRVPEPYHVKAAKLCGFQWAVRMTIDSYNDTIPFQMLGVDYVATLPHQRHATVTSMASTVITALNATGAPGAFSFVAAAFSNAITINHSANDFTFQFGSKQKTGLANRLIGHPDFVDVTSVGLSMVAPHTVEILMPRQIIIDVDVLGHRMKTSSVDIGGTWIVHSLRGFDQFAQQGNMEATDWLCDMPAVMLGTPQSGTNITIVIKDEDGRRLDADSDWSIIMYFCPCQKAWSCQK